jgi:D-sedoheptulose 7-phosphate isomerase
MLPHIKNYVNHETWDIQQINANAIFEAANILSKVKKLAGRVFIAGNGGSAATASHFANDLRKICHIDATALSDSIPTLLAYGNDNGWEQMFADSMDTPGAYDALIAISCSGASRNVIVAAQKVISVCGHVIVLTGLITSKNKLALLGCPTIEIKSKDIKIQEDLHLMVCHAIVEALSHVM